MQQYQYQAIESSTLAPTKQIFLGQDREITSAESEIYPNKLVIFQANFAGFMEMNEDTDKVGDYFANHQDWFCSCAAPMTVEPLGNNAYILAIGHLNSFGYELEPKIAVALQPQTKVKYLLQSIPIPNYTPPGYEVNFHSAMELVEIAVEGKSAIKAKTKINWQMHLEVKVKFPKFIYKLPLSLIQTTGDRILAQIIRQISPRLTQRVQKDFHSRFHLPMPDAKSRKLYKINPFWVDH